MSDFDFDKSFSDDLNKERFFDSDEADWNKVAGALDTLAKRKRRQRILLLCLLPIAALSGFSMLGLAWLHLNARAKTLESEVNYLQAALSAKVANTYNENDTIIKHIQVIAYDTIYRTIVFDAMLPYKEEVALRKVIGDSLYLVAQQAIFNNKQKLQSNTTRKGSIEIIASSDLVNENQIVQKSNTLNGLNNQVIQPLNTSGNNITILSLQTLQPSEPIVGVRSLRSLSASRIEIPPTPLHTNIMEPTFIQRLKPHDASIGVTSSWIFPRANGIQWAQGYNIGIAGHLALGYHLGLMAEGVYTEANYHIRSSDRDAVGIPSITPPTANDVLNFVEIQQPLLGFSLGMRYYLRPHRQVQPFASIAWAGSWVQEEKLRYEFKDRITGEETYVSLPSSKSGFRGDRVQYGSGARWQATPNVSIELGANWQEAFIHKQTLDGQRFGLKMSILYSW